MKLNQFKSMLKDIVKEAVREEMEGILLTENRYIPNPQDLSTFRNQLKEQIMPNNQSEYKFNLGKNIVSKSNPFADFINDSASNLSPEEISQMRQMN